MKQAIGPLVLALASLAGCGAVTPQPSATTTTAMPASENWFRVSWAPAPEPQGTRRLTGTLTNTYGSPMANIQLLAQALDAENKVLAQKIVWFGRHLEPFGSSYFEIAGLPVAQNYKVSVWSFDVIQSDSPRW